MASCCENLSIRFQSFRECLAVRREVWPIIDFELFLPEHWVENAKHCQEAGIAESAPVFRSKPQMAAEMVKRARAAGVRFGFIGADGLYGHATWLLLDWDDIC
ncbi:MAG: transposase [Candidatus Accumulibacter phosphatis]|nr:transposase [Candidatus Accumulibacter contiguus]